VTSRYRIAELELVAEFLAAIPHRRSSQTVSVVRRPVLARHE
jgi:hypothetical protein